jgi:predicted regulator of Ras-like GTPase activity (Roadblock/LC7/MglB family)
MKLDNIKSTKGVENVVLTQRDGNPIQYSGIWLSKEEIFSVSAATSAIYNCGLQLHGNNLKYILIEGKKAKILITPLRNYGGETLNKIIQVQGLKGSENEYFMAITTQPMINLGGIFLKTRKSLIDIKKHLILSGESFKPPLRHFSEKKIEEMFESSKIKDDLGQNEDISLFSFNISNETYINLEQILEEFNQHTLDLINTFITLNGGFIAADIVDCPDYDEHQLDSEATMSYALFSTADKCAWLLKKMHIDSILLECTEYFQFIQKVDKGIFSTLIAKGRQKLGLLRLIIPRYCKKIAKIIENADLEPKTGAISNINDLFGELVF